MPPAAHDDRDPERDQQHRAEHAEREVPHAEAPEQEDGAAFEPGSLTGSRYDGSLLAPNPSPPSDVASGRGGTASVPTGVSAAAARLTNACNRSSGSSTPQDGGP